MILIKDLYDLNSTIANRMVRRVGSTSMVIKDYKYHTRADEGWDNLQPSAQLCVWRRRDARLALVPKFLKEMDSDQTGQGA